MKIKKGDRVTYKDPDIAKLYGIGVVMGMTDAEYTILWAQRGLKKYKRSVLDQKLADVFQSEGSEGTIPRERCLQLGAARAGVPFNEHYDRSRVESLCGELATSGSQIAREVAEGLSKQMFTKNLALRATAKVTLQRLAELCGEQRLGASEPARQISQELFFGYVLQESDFAKRE